MTSEVLRLGFIGAGAINFGRHPLPWDHASRLETIGGIDVVCIVDPDTAQAERVLKARKESAHSACYKNCKLFKELSGLISLKPDAVFIGIPPAYRGSLASGKDIELQCVRAGINVFVEKPLSVAPPEEFEPYVEAVEKACKENGVVLSVGYMFRYHAGFMKMRELIQQHGGKVMAVNARYYFAYTSSLNKFWWNHDLSGGPIVEQATHFCDISRFLVGDIDTSTLHTITLDDSDPSGAGHLAYNSNEAEVDILPKDRIPRVTMSHWKFENAGLGTLMHSIALPGTRYEANVDVQLDGLKLSMIEPYEKTCVLRMRSIDSKDPNCDQDFTFADDDTYLTELRTFLQAVRKRDQSLIKSSYRDAAKTYAMTWAIRRKQ
ncbi:hypothetical protein FSP39_016423 [Pinctada imbricata]|uniref:Oxidoreductase n=1 Tax=Pinctada imbricata TaxID=66713 RepID=A0AA88Y8N6_PINIB|nr:hypothetical protein FSP39_016423 [Pinctada imbricata]